MRYLAVPIMLGLIIVNLYIGWRLWKRFFRFIPHMRQTPYWVLIAILTLTFWIPKFAGGILPQAVEQALYFIAGYWMCANLYLTIMILIADFVQLSRRRVKPWSVAKCKKVYGSIFLITVLLLGFGTWQANHIQTTEYQVQVTAPKAQNRTLNIALISDIHLGTIWGARRVEKIVNEINQLNPDLVLIAGDLLDDGLSTIHGKDEIAAAFQKLTSTYGTYACLGNHDSGFGSQYMPEKTVEFLGSCGITVLTDDTITIDRVVTLIGRFDPSMDLERKPIAELVDQDTELPIIVLDHQPPTRFHSDWWEEADAAGVDLTVSGHTHDGQIFPGALLTRTISVCSYGYWKGETMQSIVTSGIGTWGPTLRVGTHSEIALIHLSMSPEP